MLNLDKKKLNAAYGMESIKMERVDLSFGFKSLVKEIIHDNIIYCDTDAIHKE